MIPVTITVFRSGGSPFPPTPPPEVVMLMSAQVNAEPLVFSPRDIQSLEYVASVSLDGDTVQADEFTAVIRSYDPDFLEAWRDVSRTSEVYLEVGTDGGGGGEIVV